LLEEEGYSLVLQGRSPTMSQTKSLKEHGLAGGTYPAAIDAENFLLRLLQELVPKEVWLKRTRGYQ